MQPGHSSSNYWWVYLVRGIFAVALGAACLVLPPREFFSLVIFFGALMIADGIFSLMFLTGARRTMKNHPWLVFIAVTCIVGGILFLINPFISVVALVGLFAFWSFFAGIMNMMKAITFSSEKRSEIWYVISGMLGIVVAILLFVNPLEGSITLGMIFGVYALIVGISLVSFGIKLKRRFITKKHKNVFAGHSMST